MAKEDVEVVMGLRAGLAVIAVRPHEVVRVAFTAAQRRSLSEVLREAGRRRIACFEVTERELARIAVSEHHEGLAVVARARKWRSSVDVASALAQSQGIAVALDKVRNPYNIGAILRSAAFFGVDAVLLGTPAPHPGLPPIAVRVAEGGAEHLMLSRTTDLAETLRGLRTRGVRVLGTDADAKLSSARAPHARPVIIVVGNEREGLGERVRAQCDALVGIRGSGSIDSLNVAVATGILLAQNISPAAK